MKKWLLLIGLTGLGLVLWWQSRGAPTESGPKFSEQITAKIENIAPSPSPIPFAELTIPSLRVRDYESSITEQVQVGDNSQFKTYLASYTSDGLKLNGLMLMPRGEAPEGGWPAIVFVHGYIPPQEYRTRENYLSYAEAIVRGGIVVFKIDLRGHDQSEGEPGGAYYSEDYVVDTLNAVAALADEAEINKGRIGLWGHSMAGNVTLRSLTARPELSAAVIWAGAGFTYEDFVKYGVDDNSYRPPPEDSVRTRERARLRELYGTYTAGHPFWEQVSPKNYLGDITGSVQLHHATDDPVVNVGYSRDLAKLLEEKGVDFEFYEYDNGGHNLTGEAFVKAMERTVEFFQNNL